MLNNWYWALLQRPSLKLPSIAACTGWQHSMQAPSQPSVPHAQRLKGAVFDLCRDQHGSRYVQTRLETAPDDEVRAAPNLTEQVHYSATLSQC